MRSMGLAAEAFASGEDFLRSPDLSRIACLVADVNMPGMSGLDLYRQLSAINKSIPTILITGLPVRQNSDARAQRRSHRLSCKASQ
jgi:FixJ family two-component response regulator